MVGKSGSLKARDLHCAVSQSRIRDDTCNHAVQSLEKIVAWCSAKLMPAFESA